MFNYKSMSNDELRDVLANAGAELLSRRSLTADSASKPHTYRITMRRTSRENRKRFGSRWSKAPLSNSRCRSIQIIGKTGKMIGGEFLLDDGDVIQKVFASGMERYYIAWQGGLDHPDWDAYQGTSGRYASRNGWQD